MLYTKKMNLPELDEGDQERALDMAAELLALGGTVVFPTETVYGLGANALDERAVKSIYVAKGRPSDNPLIVHIASLSQVKDIAREVPASAEALMKAFWPGPLTIILPKKEGIPEVTTGGLDTVGIRMPDHEVARELIRRSNCPVAAPSANISGRPSPTTYQRCLEDLSGRVDVILGSDPSKVGVESTIVDCSGAVPEILRPGAITAKMLEEVVGQVFLKTSIGLPQEEAPRAPGMKYKHYAPKAKVILWQGNSPEKVSQALKGKASKKEAVILIQESQDLGEKSASVLNEDLGQQWSQEPSSSELNVDDQGILHGRHFVELPSFEIALHEIFELLRHCDDLGYEVIHVQAVPEEDLGLTLMNRLKKAAGGDIREV